MSQHNAEIIREFLAAFNREDYAACLDAIDPDVEWHPPPDLPNAAIANSRDALIATFQDWLGAWAGYRVVPEEIFEAGDDTVLVSAQESAHGKDSGVEVHSRRIVGLYHLRAGRIVRFKAYLDRAEALEAAGVREHADVGAYRRTSREVWEAMAPGWERWRAQLAEALTPLREWLVSALGPRPGETVLELGAGPARPGSKRRGSSVRKAG